MGKARLRLLLTLCVMFCLVCPWAQAVTLVHTNDVLGELEPCGCRKNPQGGMARKANLLKKMDDSFILSLDAGDLLFQSLDIPELLTDQAQLQAEFLLKSMELVHHDAAVPGEKDFALGFKVFENMRKKASFPFLAANLKKKNGGKYLESSKVFSGKNKEGQTIRVGVIGVVGAKLKWPKELKALAPVSIIKQEVSRLRKKVDYVVILSHQGLEEDVVLAKKAYGIDVIIGAHSQSFLQTPAVFGKTWILQSSFRNQYVGVLRLNPVMKEQDYQLIGLDAGYDSPVEMPSPIDLLVKDFKKSIAQLNSKQLSSEENPSVALDHDGRSYQTFPKCAQCHMKQFDFWRKTSHAQSLATLMEKEQSKNKECLLCHTVGLGDPHGYHDINRLSELTQLGSDELTVHSQEQTRTLIRALSDAQSAKDSIKLPSSDQAVLPQEPLSMMAALNRVHKAWAPVQCENCHGPGGKHPFSGQYSKLVESKTCLNCHTAERAPSWYSSSGQPNLELIDKKKKSISCPSGDLSESE